MSTAPCMVRSGERIKVPSLKGMHWLMPGVLDYNARIVFLNGMCMDLAAAINRRVGLPVYILSDDDMDYAYRAISDNVLHQHKLYHGMYHAVVKLPDGRFLDVNGVGSEEDKSSTLYATINGWFVKMNKATKTCIEAHTRKIIDDDIMDAFVDSVLDLWVQNRNLNDEEPMPYDYSMIDGYSEHDPETNFAWH